MLELLRELRVFAKKDGKYWPTTNYDRRFCRNLFNLLMELDERDEIDPTKVDDYVNAAIISTLKDLKFFDKERSLDEINFAVQILRVFLKDSVIEELGKILGR